MNEKIKVLHILEATLGGTRRYLEDFARAIDYRKFECALIYSLDRSDKQFFQTLKMLAQFNWRLYNVNMVREINLFKDVYAIRKIYKIINEYSPDLIHCHSSKAGGLGRLAFVFVTLRKFFKFNQSNYKCKAPKIIYTPNALPNHLGLHYAVLELILSRFTHYFVAISESEKKEIARRCLVDKDKIFVVWPIIDTEYYVPMNKVESRYILGIPEQSFVVVGIGRMSYQKDPFTFLRVIEDLSKKYNNIFALWVGDGELKNEINKIIESKKIKNVFITGWKTDVRRYIAASDVVLMPSIFESFGYVAAEALAMERPVVGTRVTGLVDILPDERLFFDPRDWRKASSIVQFLLESPHEAALIGNKGRKIVEKRFSLKSMKYLLEEAYQKSVSSP